MKKIILLIHITYLTAVGLGGASLQVDAVSLAHNGTGIAGDVNISINPVSILNVSNNKLSFSYNNWFNEVKGSMIKHEFNNQYILLNTYELNDIELWGDKPDSNPIGTFGTHYISLAYGRGFRFDNLKFGAQSNAIHARLYTESTLALLFTISFKYNISSSFSIGSVVKNFGFINSDLEKNKIPFTNGIGCAYKINKLNSTFMLDYLNDDLSGSATKIALSTNYRFLNFILAISSVDNKSLYFDEKIFISGGFEFKYRNWTFSYGILQQDNESLGVPQSFQISWYY